MWVYLAITGIVLGAGYWVGYPLLKPKNPGSPPATIPEDFLADLKIEKEEIYSALKEMELDHKMGKLSGDDHLKLREKYMAKAIDNLKKTDELEGKGGLARGIEEEIEKEVLTLRIDNKKRRQGKTAFCPQCGKKGTPEDRFCSRCGKKLAALKASHLKGEDGNDES